MTETAVFSEYDVSGTITGRLDCSPTLSNALGILHRGPVTTKAFSTLRRGQYDLQHLMNFYHNKFAQNDWAIVCIFILPNLFRCHLITYLIK